MLLLTARAALACGGFFCDRPDLADPIVQTEERILFQVEPTGEVTAYIEIQYEGEPTDFAWLLPVAGPIDADNGIRTASAGLFDDLEEHTAPTFRSIGARGAVLACSGVNCCGPSGGDISVGDSASTSGVERIGSAVVGPYAIEILTATEGDNLLNWLQLNGYSFPRSAAEPLQHYVDLGLQFIAVKLLPDISEGPIETLAVSCAAGSPVIPLLLTAISSAPELEITAYVLGRERYVPENYADLVFDYRRVELVSGETDYEDWLSDDVMGAGGQAWNTEFAGPVSSILGDMPSDTELVLSRGFYLTRFHTFLSPQDMTLDPTFAPEPGAPDVDNIHVVGVYEPGSGTSDTGTAALLLGGLGFAGAAVRRARVAR